MEDNRFGKFRTECAVSGILKDRQIPHSTRILHVTKILGSSGVSAYRESFLVACGHFGRLSDLSTMSARW